MRSRSGFILRDMLWLAAVVALAVGWRQQARALNRQLEAATAETDRLQTEATKDAAKLTDAIWEAKMGNRIGRAILDARQRDIEKLKELVPPEALRTFFPTQIPPF